MKIGFAGLSHLGIVSSIATASKNTDVLAFDPDKNICDALSLGKLPLHEPGLDDLLKASQKKITFTSRVEDLASCDLIYFSKDISTDENNRSDLAPTEALIDAVLPAAKAGTILVMLSQVPPGFMRKLDQKIKTFHAAKSFQLFYQVETLVFGNAVERAVKPERFIVGCGKPEQPLPAIFQDLLAKFSCPIFPMRYESAELAKISINICLAASVNTANTLAELCEAVGADWREIVPSLKTDKRIGAHAYLSPGLGLSGGNLERDLVTVKTLAAEHGTDAGIVDAWFANSDHRRDWVFQTLHRELLSKTTQPVIAVWGLAYKPNTLSVKNSPSMALLKDLSSAARIQWHDPKARLDQAIPNASMTESALAACKQADALVLMTPWEEYLKIPARDIAAALKGKLILDPFGVLDEKSLKALKVNYFRLGARGSSHD